MKAEIRIENLEWLDLSDKFKILQNCVELSEDDSLDHRINDLTELSKEGDRAREMDEKWGVLWKIIGITFRNEIVSKGINPESMVVSVDIE